MVTPPSRPRVMLVFPATSYRPDAFVAAARELDVDLVLASDWVEAAARFELPTVQVSFRPDAELPEDLPHVQGVVAVDERSALVAAAMHGAGVCELPYHSLEGVLAAADKGRMRERLSAAGVRCPDVVARIGRGDSPPKVSFPCVLKPPRLSGSQGVIRVDDEEAYAAAVAHLRGILHRHPKAERADEGFFELVVERYVDGPEVAVEGLMREGRFSPVAIFDKPDPLEGPFFEETIYVTPSRLSAEEQRSLHAFTELAANGLGLTDGPVHAEVRLGGGQGPFLIEIAARSIGGLCSRALVHVLGSLEQHLLAHAAARPRPAIRADAPASGVMMIPVPASGVVRAIHGVANARAVAGVDAVNIAIVEGETVRAPPDGDAYLGFIFGHGDTPLEVAEVLRAAHAALRFEVTPLLPIWPTAWA